MFYLPRTVRMVMALAVVALGVLVLPGVSPVPAVAADNGSWSVSPTPPEKATTSPRNYFILEGAPGAVIEDSLRVENWTEDPFSFRIYGADGYNTPRDGFFALREFDEDMTDAGSWVEPVTSQVTVHGRTRTDIPITITIPKNATPGDHVGGVVAMNVKVESADGGEAVDVGIQRAVAARMYVRVSGTTSPGLELSDVQVDHDRGWWPWTGQGTGTVTYTVENTGNLRLSPTGDVTLSGLFISDRSWDTQALVDLLPGQRVTLTQEISGVPWFGSLGVDVDLTAGEELAASDGASAWIVPWPFVVLALALLTGAIFVLVRRTGVLRRKLRAAEEAPQISVTSGV